MQIDMVKSKKSDGTYTFPTVGVEVKMVDADG